jgi:type IV pilus assembly protein PilB
MAQRLIPKLCPVCRKSRRSTDLEKVRIEKLTGVRLKDQIYHANVAGCRSCHKGYVGRSILTEIIPVDAAIREMLLRAQQNIPSAEIAEHATKHFKYSPLLNQAIELVNESQVDLRDAQRLFLDFGE